VVTNTALNLDRESVSQWGGGDKEHMEMFLHCSSSAETITPKQSLAGEGSIFLSLMFGVGGFTKERRLLCSVFTFPLRAE